jgi:hypothetical protein
VWTGEIAAASPSSYSRGEGQKLVSKAYKDNWNVIFAKKTIIRTMKRVFPKSAKGDLMAPARETWFW